MSQQREDTCVPFKDIFSACAVSSGYYKTAGTYKKWQWPNSTHITYARHVLLLWHTYLHTYIYRTSSNLYTPDSVSLARQLSLLTETSPKSKSNSTSTEYARVNSQALSSNTCRLAHEPCDKTVKQNHSAIVSALNNLYEDTHELEAAL